jgi:hypothetical protein
MDKHEFADKLFPEVSLSEIDFACDVERLMAEQIKYLRGLIASANKRNQLERDTLVAELRSRIADMDKQISYLRRENDALRSLLSG